MHKKNFLVTSVAAKVQLIKTLKYSCEQFDVKLFGTDIKIESAALYFAHSYFLLPKLNNDKYLFNLLEHCHKHDIGFIIPTRDEDLCFFSDHIDVLESNGITVCQSPKKTIQICNNKFLFRAFCVENGFSIPSQYKIENDISYPCVVKLAQSSSSNGVFIIKNQFELNKITAGHAEKTLILEEFINFQEFSIDAFFDSNGCFVQAVARERIFVSDGEAKISKTVRNDDLIYLAKRLGEKLMFVGHIVIQAFYNKGSYFLIEINPRFGGASNLSIKAGLDSTNKLIGMMLGNSPKINNINYNLLMLRYSEDFFIETE